MKAEHGGARTSAATTLTSKHKDELKYENKLFATWLTYTEEGRARKKAALSIPESTLDALDAIAAGPFQHKDTDGKRNYTLDSVARTTPLETFVRDGNLFYVAGERRGEPRRSPAGEFIFKSQGCALRFVMS